MVYSYKKNRRRLWLKIMVLGCTLGAVCLGFIAYLSSGVTEVEEAEDERKVIAVQPTPPPPLPTPPRPPRPVMSAPPPTITITSQRWNLKHVAYVATYRVSLPPLFFLWDSKIQVIPGHQICFNYEDGTSGEIRIIIAETERKYYLPVAENTFHWLRTAPPGVWIQNTPEFNTAWVDARGDTIEFQSLKNHVVLTVEIYKFR